MKQITKKKLNDVSPQEWDIVSRPAHYNNGDIECIDGIEAMLTKEEFIGYLRGNSLKYRWRFPYKKPPFFLDFSNKMLYNYSINKAKRI